MMKQTMTRAAIVSLAIFALSGFSPAYSGENETAPERTILMEQFTSQGCGACPTTFREVAAQTVDYRIVRLNYHRNDAMSTEETNEYIGKFTTLLPNFLVDRALDEVISGHKVLPQAMKRAALTPEMSIDLNLAYDTVTRRTELDITLRALTDLEYPCLLYVILKESRLNYEQNYEGKLTYPYYHSDVVREFLTGAKGELLSDTTIPEGTEIRKTCSFTLKDLYNSNFCNFVVFVNRNIADGYGPVLQAAETALYNAEPLAVTETKPSKNIFHAAYPNPFNTETTIEYTMPETAHVRLGVYDILGRLVTVLTEDVKSAGTYRAVWRGSDSHGNPLSSGVYFFRLTAGTRTAYGKLLYLK